MLQRWVACVAVWSLCAGGAGAGDLGVGEAFPPYTLTDPFGVTNRLGSETRAVIISSEKNVSERVNAWLKTKPHGYLEAHRADYVSDITPMPALITTLFALPKMRKYPFRLLLAQDEAFAKTYPHRPGQIALFLLDAGHVITDLHFVDQPAQLEALLEQAAP